MHAEFLQWKGELERDSSAHFMKSTGEKIVHKTKVLYFYCNRSGFFKSESKDIRSLKKQGSCKIGSYCTASIECEHLENGNIKAIINKTHYGHQSSLGHIRIPEQDRLAIAAWFTHTRCKFWQFNILNKIRDTHIDRLHLLTRQDLRNIEMSFNIRQEQRHLVDAVSVKLWVEEMRASDDNPVLFFKEQGKIDATIGLNRGLCVNDFALAIQSPLYRQNCSGNAVIGKWYVLMPHMAQQLRFSINQHPSHWWIWGGVPCRLVPIQ